MAMTFGHRWTSQFGTEDDGTWQQGLRGITPDQVRSALEAIDQSGEAWPPSLPEFRALCRGRNGFGLDYTPEVYRRRETEPTRMIGSDQSQEQRAANLQRFRTLVRGSLNTETEEKKGRQGEAAEQASKQAVPNQCKPKVSR